jgi:hypothetical protein
MNRGKAIESRVSEYSIWGLAEGTRTIVVLTRAKLERDGARGGLVYR